MCGHGHNAPKAYSARISLPNRRLSIQSTWSRVFINVASLAKSNARVKPTTAPHMAMACMNFSEGGLVSAHLNYLVLKKLLSRSRRKVQVSSNHNVTLNMHGAVRKDMCCVSRTR